MRLAALVLMTSCVRFVPLPSSAETHRAKTDDGWEISLVRYRAVGPTTGRPVLLCHGISANERNMDLDEGHSFARWLAAHGREAWTMSLRATGQSDQADPKNGRAKDYAFDEFWKQDLPAAVATVRATAQADAIDFVGHSMGGLVLYAYLAEGGTGIAAAATLGTPTNLQIGTLTGGLIASLPLNIDVPTGLGAHVAAPFQGLWADDPMERLFYNPKNTPVPTWARLMAYGTDDIAGGVVKQLASIGRGEFKSVDGAIDFRADMAKITTPVLVVAARLDRVAPVPAVKDGYRALGGPKEWLMVSEAHGAQAEYGHMDLVVGERAGDEVWSKVLAFLDRHGKDTK